MRRRDFLLTLAAPVAAAPGSDYILVHEHILVDFNRGRVPYSQDVVFDIAKPHLDAVRKLGVRRFLECTPNFVGRDTKLLQRLASATGIEIWTNTGLYAARMHELLPDYAKTESAAQLAKRWIEEYRRGVDGMKPRFIKIGVNKGRPLPDIDRNIVRAAAICSKETGLPIQSHTGDGMAALDQLDLIAEQKLDPSRWVWVHAQSEKDHAIHEQVARAGAWVQFDGVSPKSIDWHLDCVRFMQGKALLRRTLLSHDAGFYRPGEPNGGTFRPFTTIFTDVVPKIDAAWTRALLVENPLAAYGK
jgi:phosphotriesterase-related protein